eukprot:XP_765975.1 hypothetical protein [Theileria parva strain Muguga]
MQNLKSSSSSLIIKSSSSLLITSYINNPTIIKIVDKTIVEREKVYECKLLTSNCKLVTTK